MTSVVSIRAIRRHFFVVSTRAALARFALSFAFAGKWVLPVLAAGLMPDLEVCESKIIPMVPRGELLARAEDLRDSADRFRHYDYDRCYRLGRSCFNEVDSKIMNGVERDSYSACRHLETTNRGDQVDWLRKKQIFVGCLIADMEKRAQSFEDKAKDANGVGRVTVSTVLGDLERRSGVVDAATLKRLAGGSTWCSTRGGNEVRVLCEDGSGALADGKGQKVISWQVEPDGRLCFVTFDGPQTCYSVSINGGLFALHAPDGRVLDVVRIVPRVEASWSESCSKPR